VFSNQSYHKQIDVKIQIAVALERLGCDGNGVSVGRIAVQMGLGYGTVHLYTSRVIKALMSIQKDFIHWPTDEEKRVCSEYMDERYCLKGTVGIVDGSHFNLSQRPSVDGEVYWTRKYNYSMNVQVHNSLLL